MLLIACWLIGRLLWEGAMLPIGSARNMEPNAVQAARPETDKENNGKPISSDPLKQSGFRTVTEPGAVSEDHFSFNRFESNCCGAPDQKGGIVMFQRAQPRSGGARAIPNDDYVPIEQPARNTSRFSSEERSEKGATKNRPTNDSALSGHAWLIVRQRSGQNLPLRDLAVFQLPGQLPGQSYGGSQVGAQLALRMAGETDRHISLTARVSTALASSGEEEVAVGAKVKPLQRIPITIHAEQRFNLANTRFRGTAVYAAGGTGPDTLPGQLTVETYGQGGYLFGNTDTYFFDAAATVQRDVLKSRLGKVTAGLGLWAGGQRGVSRIDIGPSAKVILPLGETQARVGLDWRQRISGTARPGSGLTVSVSTGF